MEKGVLFSLFVLYYVQFTKEGLDDIMKTDKRIKFDLNSPDPCGIIGKVFGKLTVIAYMGHYHDKGSRYQYWYKVRCSCRAKTEKIYTYRDLISGNATSCGLCKRSEPILVGDKFGELTVVEILPPKSGSNHSRAICECSCPGHPRVTVDQTRLRTGATRTCGGGWHYIKEEYTGRLKLGPLPNSELEVLEICKTKRSAGGDRIAICKCHHVNPITHVECNRIFEAEVDNLLSGNTKTCGCSHNIYPNEESRALGGKWFSMTDRCNNEKAQSYDDYGGRGIKVCDEWNGGREERYRFINDALELGYKKGSSIDRTDNNGPYSRDNIRFVDMSVQNNNKRNNHYINVDGKTQSAADWARELNVDVTMFTNKLRAVTDAAEYVRRLRSGVEKIEDYISRDMRRERRPRSDKGITGRVPTILTVNNESLLLSEWNRRLGLSETYLHTYKWKNGLEATIKLIQAMNAGILTIDNVSKTFAEWEDEFHTPRGFCYRMYKKYNGNLLGVIDELKYWKQTKEMPL